MLSKVHLKSFTSGNNSLFQEDKWDGSSQTYFFLRESWRKQKIPISTTVSNGRMYDRLVIFSQPISSGNIYTGSHVSVEVEKNCHDVCYNILVEAST